MKIYTIRKTKLIFISLFLTIISNISSADSICDDSENFDDSENLLNKYVEYWGNEEYQEMFCMVSNRLRRKTNLETFEKDFYEYQDLSGLPVEFEIVDIIQDLGNKKLWQVSVQFSNTHVGEKQYSVYTEEVGKGWAIGEGPFLTPNKLSNLFK
jgi:hypothetical protein